MKDETKDITKFVTVISEKLWLVFQKQKCGIPVNCAKYVECVYNASHNVQYYS